MSTSTAPKARKALKQPPTPARQTPTPSQTPTAMMTPATTQTPTATITTMTPAASSSPMPTPTPQRETPAPRPIAFVDRGQPVPAQYGVDRLVALPKDPAWLFAYWELALPAQRTGLSALPWAIRVHRLDEGVAVDLDVDPQAGNWYVKVGKPGRYQLELGVVLPDGQFVPLLASQVAQTPGAPPPAGPGDDEWEGAGDDPPISQEGLEAIIQYLSRPEFSDRGASHARQSQTREAEARKGALQAIQAAHAAPGSGGLARRAAEGGAALARPSRDGGPNWHRQPNLPPRKPRPNAARVTTGLPSPLPAWPPGGQAAPGRGQAPARG